MKKLLLGLGLAVALAACKKQDSFLEPRTSTLTEDIVFSDSVRTVAFLTRIYGDIGYSFNKSRWANGGNIEQATDDAEYTFTGSGNPSVQLYSGTYTPLQLPSTDFWQTPWDNIRRVNLLLSKLPDTPLSKGTQTQMVAQARFLRAWYYFLLLEHFGGMPLIGDKVFDLNDDINLPRSSFADCVTYISQELDAVAQVVPTQSASAPSTVDYGRITPGVCLALKSRLLLYAASPLFNGGATTTDPSLAALVSYPTYSASRWQDAANAALAVMNTNLYSLVVDNTTAPGYGFVSVFQQRVNPEYIYFVNRPPNKDFEGAFLPTTRGGSGSTLPSQNLVDAYLMKNGKRVTDANSGYDPLNPYLNREPRFYNSIIYNGANFFLVSASAQRPVYTYDGAASDGYQALTSSTGYYFRKMLDPTIAANSATNTPRGWPLIRYAEILLNYAEAINELGQPETAVNTLKLLRGRAGVDAGTDGRFGIPVGVSTSQLRDIIQNERRIELALEDHRWNDIRRWKIAVTVNNGFNRRMQVINRGTAAAPGPYTYNITNSLRQHVFRPEMYLMPIPDIEIRRVPLFRQNPGW